MLFHGVSVISEHVPARGDRKSCPRIFPREEGKRGARVNRRRSAAVSHGFCASTVRFVAGAA